MENLNTNIKMYYFNSKENFVNTLKRCKAYVDGTFVPAGFKSNGKFVTLQTATKSYLKNYAEYLKAEKKGLAHLKHFICYQTMISLMKVFKKDCLYVEDFNHVLQNLEQYFNKYFNENLLENQNTL